MTSKLGIVSLALALFAAAGVFTLKDQVRRAESRLTQVRASLIQERLELGRLRAEWAMLEEPERLARLADQHLRLQPAHPGQIVAIDDIPHRADLEFAGRRLPVILPSGAETTLRLKPALPLSAPWRQATMVAAGGRP